MSLQWFELPEATGVATPGYVKEEIPKTSIVLHFTAGTSVAGAVNHWRGSRSRLGTAYIIDRDGKSYRVFDPKYWANHLGAVRPIEQRTIGIELVNLGPLWLQDGFLMDAYKRRYCRQIDKEKYFESALFRGVKYWVPFPEIQASAAANLLVELCDQFKIPKRIPAPSQREKVSPDWGEWSGIISHQNIRADKYDVGPAFPWRALEEAGFEST